MTPHVMHKVQEAVCVQGVISFTNSFRIIAILNCSHVKQLLTRKNSSRVRGRGHRNAAQVHDRWRSAQAKGGNG
jgi:hypothetical protein